MDHPGHRVPPVHFHNGRVEGACCRQPTEILKQVKQADQLSCSVAPAELSGCWPRVRGCALQDQKLGQESGAGEKHEWC